MRLTAPKGGIEEVPLQEEMYCSFSELRRSTQTQMAGILELAASPTSAIVEHKDWPRQAWPAARNHISGQCNLLLGCSAGVASFPLPPADYLAPCDN
jgi:hypothetical protein